jgi:hypothetical protein
MITPNNDILKDSHPIFQKNKDIIEQANSIELFEIKERPILRKEQKKENTYINDYEVIKKITIESSNLDNLKKIVLDTANYEMKDKKTCPFLPKYALKFTKKKSYITLILANGECNKTYIYSSAKHVSHQNFDLKYGNQIESLLNELIKN